MSLLSLIRIISHRSLLTDPDAIAQKAQALLDQGLQVRLLGAKRWICTPPVADYRRVAVTWAGPRAALPVGWTPGPAMNGLRLLYTDDPDLAAPPPADNRQICQARLDWLEASRPRIFFNLLVFFVVLVALRLLEPEDSRFLWADGLRLGFALLGWEGLFSQIYLLAVLQRQRTVLRRARDADATPPPLPCQPLALRVVTLVVLLAALVCIGFGVPALLALLLLLCVLILLQLYLQFYLMAKGVPAPSARRRTAFLPIVVLVVVVTLSTTGVLPWKVTLRPEHQTVTVASAGSRLYEVVQDPLPLTLDQLEPDLPRDLLWNCERESWQSPLLRATHCEQYALNDGAYLLSYWVADPALPPVQTLLELELVSSHPRYGSYRPVSAEEAAPWQARQVYRLYWGDVPMSQYLIFWPGRVVEIFLDDDPTETQMATVAAALAPQ